MSVSIRVVYTSKLISALEVSHPIVLEVGELSARSRNLFVIVPSGQKLSTQTQSTETIPCFNTSQTTHTQTVFRDLSVIDTVKWWFPAGLQAGTHSCVFTGTKHFWNSL